MKKRIQGLGVLILLFFSGCSKSDETAFAIPEVSYGEEIITTFLTEGSSSPPEVNWNGDVGQFGLEKAVIGITIDSKTGVISWGKQLPIGITEIRVLVFNNAGITRFTADLNNKLDGKFNGILFPLLLSSTGTTDFQIEFDFDLDGSMTGFTRSRNNMGEVNGPFLFEGNYSAEGNSIKGQFNYISEQTPNFFEGSVSTLPTGVEFKGRYANSPDEEKWFSEFDTYYITEEYP